MRHRVAGKKLGRKTPHRISMFRNMVTSLLDKERVRTTLDRAKAVRPIAERMITLGKRESLHARRQALAYIKDPAVVAKLFETLAPRFSQRPGGYTRIIRLGFRDGDGAQMAYLELIGSEFKPKKARKAKARKARKSRKARRLKRVKKRLRPKPIKNNIKKSSPGSTSQSDSTKYVMNFDKVPRAKLPTNLGEFIVHGFHDLDSGEEAVALVVGDPNPDTVALVRIHSQCLTGDVFESRRCDCGDQLKTAMRLIGKAESGVLIYQQQEGRGIGLINKIRAYELQDNGLDTVAANLTLGFDADMRDYHMPAEILKYFGATRIHLLSNNPEKVQGLEQEGIRVEKRVPLEIAPHSHTRDYLKIKKEKLGHLLSDV
jgi:ribosomal protein L17